MFEIRSDDLQQARVEFKKHVNWLVTYAKEQRKQGTPLSLLRRKRLVNLMCQRWMRWSLQLDIDNPYPPSYDLTRLADVLLQE
jgi:hypothetical protein